MSAARTPQVGEFWHWDHHQVEILGIDGEHCWVKLPDERRYTVRFDFLDAPVPVVNLIEELWYCPDLGFVVDGLNVPAKDYIHVGTLSALSDDTFRFDPAEPNSD